MKSRENKGENKEQVMSPQMSTTVARYIFNSTLAADGNQDCTLYQTSVYLLLMIL